MVDDGVWVLRLGGLGGKLDTLERSCGWVIGLLLYFEGCASHGLGRTAQAGRQVGGIRLLPLIQNISRL